MADATRDLVVRFAALARSLKHTIDVPYAPPEEQLMPLTQALDEALHSLVEVDSQAHRYRTVRALCLHVRGVLSDKIGSRIMDELDADPEAAAIHRCLANDSFQRLATELLSEMETFDHAEEWSSDIGEAAQVTVVPPNSDSSAGSANGPDKLDMMLHVEIQAELPPFLELPAILAAAHSDDPAAMHEAWERLSAFSAADLLESEQWPRVPTALRAFFSALPTVQLTCASLHAALYEEAMPRQRAHILLNVAAFVTEATGRHGSWPTYNASGALSNDDGRPHLLLHCAELLNRGRHELCHDWAMIGTAPLREVLAEIVNLARAPEADGVADGVLSPEAGNGTALRALSAAPGDIGVASSAWVLASLDPSARWIARLLARERTHEAAWQGVCRSGLLTQAAELLLSCCWHWLLLGCVLRRHLLLADLLCCRAASWRPLLPALLLRTSSRLGCFLRFRLPLLVRCCRCLLAASILPEAGRQTTATAGAAPSTLPDVLIDHVLRGRAPPGSAAGTLPV